ncbi:putative CMRF35-like molecule 1 [Scophthalmus maximus]|uniref:Putative CMRF35-like molecule 1 n=1 Tax=Scophthalmus maximus TaxID=52904 RepID=A0A2U9CBN4_SCOMX|nr:putative CMRF35-like molecule 1 [Scophthalmus maximus]
MAVHLRILLVLIGLTGIYGMATVNQVSVKAGDSITIPCLYEGVYRNHVKYLCKGRSWSSCTYAVKTNKPDSSGKFSISDDKSQRTFNVTIKDLTHMDTDYWCIVEIHQGTDVGESFQLSFTRGAPALYVDDQEIKGFIGDSISISCHYSASGEMKWCRLGGVCVTGLSGSIDGTGVTIESRDPNVFTVTMSGLTTESSGWYLCVKGALQMPAHVTVTEKHATTTLATTSCLSPTPDDHNPGDHSASIDLESLVIPLTLLIFIVMVTLFIWFMLKKRKQRNSETSNTTTKEEVTHCNVRHRRKTSEQTEEDVTYYNVGYKKKASDRRPHAESDIEVMYSSVVTIKQQGIKREKAQDDDVTYSKLALTSRTV